MKVEFKNGFRIRTDSLQFIAEKKKIIQAGAKTKESNIGNVAWDHISYCTNLDESLRSIGHQLCLDIDGLQDIKIALNSLEKEIKAMTKELQVEVTFDDEN